jgi:nitroimidazol reductase NimA-like FMN-containing flavoprotein (pyridoxamine 5'-phosphate oxidase superfamily)
LPERDNRDTTLTEEVAMIEVHADAVVEQLGEPECKSLLDITNFGRIGFCDERGPMILPVNYVIVVGEIVFRTDAKTVLTNVSMKSVVFEIDGWESTSVAWSVVARGHALEVTRALGAQYDELRAAHIPILAPGAKSHWFAMDVESISGRRITTAVAAVG